MNFKNLLNTIFIYTSFLAFSLCSNSMNSNMDDLYYGHSHSVTVSNDKEFELTPNQKDLLEKLKIDSNSGKSVNIEFTYRVDKYKIPFLRYKLQESGLITVYCKLLADNLYFIEIDDNISITLDKGYIYIADKEKIDDICISLTLIESYRYYDYVRFIRKENHSNFIV